MCLPRPERPGEQHPDGSTSQEGEKGGATYGIRTRDIQDHNLALYRLS